MVVSKYHRTTAAIVAAELNIHLDDAFPAKTFRRELHKSTIHGRAAIAKRLIIKNNVKMHNLL